MLGITSFLCVLVSGWAGVHVVEIAVHYETMTNAIGIKEYLARATGDEIGGCKKGAFVYSITLLDIGFKQLNP